MGAAAAAAMLGAIVAVHYHRLGLTLTHYDARGHLVVARRIVDSITPGWQQIGAVWLPLPHLLNALPVQIDLFYRTGASAVALSIVSFAIATASIAWIGAAITGSTIAALAGAAVFALNPNVLYLQSTPMTEPLLLACVLLAVAVLIEHVRADLHVGGAVGRPKILHDERPLSSRRGPAAGYVGWAFALACLTRYEAWPVAAAALAAAVWTRWRGGDSPAIAVREIVRALSGPVLVWIGVAGIAWLAATGFAMRKHAAALIVVSLVTMAAVPWAAFVKGHPFRVRYALPLIAVEANGAAALAGVSKRARVAVAVAVVAAAAYELRPLDASAPMVVEARWDQPNLVERARVTACLGAPHAGDKIMASMGSLGHYMQEASSAGFQIRDFLHEGNGDLWLAAIDGPRPFARWIAIEEKAQGGDVLAKLAREHPRFLEGYTRVCDAVGLALYRRAEGSALP